MNRTWEWCFVDSTEVSVQVCVVHSQIGRNVPLIWRYNWLTPEPVKCDYLNAPRKIERKKKPRVRKKPTQHEIESNLIESNLFKWSAATRMYNVISWHLEVIFNQIETRKKEKKHVHIFRVNVFERETASRAKHEKKHCQEQCIAKSKRDRNTDRQQQQQRDTRENTNHTQKKTHSRFV